MASAPPPPPHPSAGPSSSAAPAGGTRSDYARYLLTPSNPHPSPLSGTQDLLTLFNLTPVYNTFLRPYLDPALLASHPSALPAFGAPADSPASPGVTGKVELGTGAGAGGKGKGRAASPAAVGSPAPGGGGGAFKITLGGIKLGSTRASPSPSPSVGPEAAAASGTGGQGKPPKRLKMEKGFEWMVGDVLGLPPNLRRPPPTSSTYLRDLVLNPDPAPCPPLLPFDADSLRAAFALEKGGLAGFDMGVWEGKPAVGQGAGGEKKRKKKRKHDSHQPGGAGESDAKKQRR
ncbi:hypothetical protein JCM10213_002048 [Rhodosporidiobolus nylandii]